MKVALYYPWVYLTGGPERIIVQLAAGSRHRWTIFTNHYEPEATFPEMRQLEVIELPRVSVRRSFHDVAVAAWRIARQKLPLEGYDALVVLSEGLGDFATFRNHDLPIICLCLTPLRAAFDPYYQCGYLAMHRDRPWSRLALGAAGAAFRTADRLAWKRYERVLAISGEVRRRVLRGRLCPEGKIELLRPGIDPARLTPGALYEKTFLIPGRIMWTKNIELGIDAFRLLAGRRPDLKDYRLIIAGIVDEKSRSYAARLRARADGCPGIVFIESPSDRELLSLYQSACAVVYPPFNEDWGLVPLEAMACGKPVIALNRGGPVETVVDGETGFLADPAPEAFADAMERLADDPELPRRMGARGRQRALRFQWKDFCEGLDGCLDRVVNGRQLAA